MSFLGLHSAINWTKHELEKIPIAGQGIKKIDDGISSGISYVNEHTLRKIPGVAGVEDKIVGIEKTADNAFSFLTQELYKDVVYLIENTNKIETGVYNFAINDVYPLGKGLYKILITTINGLVWLIENPNISVPTLAIFGGSYYIATVKSALE